MWLGAMCVFVLPRIFKAGADSLLRHTIEIPLVFNTASLFDAGSKEERAAKEVGERWAAFAIDGVPGSSQAGTTAR